ncbi:MAG: energy transducer TonB [Muribaculaceae bacterium]|nr:energy transducer TonB [Muribaculaceae bacterium]
MLRTLILFVAIIAANVAYSQDEAVYEEITYGYEPASGMPELDTYPLYPGGLNGLMSFLSKNISYPVQAVAENIEGRVIVNFVVNVEGNVSQVEIVKSVHPLLDKEAIRVLKMLTGFIPGKINGENVDVWFTLPINFKLPPKQSQPQSQKRPVTPNLKY